MEAMRCDFSPTKSADWKPGVPCKPGEGVLGQAPWLACWYERSSVQAFRKAVQQNIKGGITDAHKAFGLRDLITPFSAE